MKLNREVYNGAALYTAVQDFSHIATIEYAEKGSYWEITFSNCKADAALVQMEFENYLIDVINA